MIRSPRLFLFVFPLIACALFALESTAAQENSANPQYQATTPQTENSGVELKVAVPLVLEDVIVVDDNDVPVHGLKASDFAVTEDGRPVTVRDFTENIAEQTPVTPLKPLNLGPNTFTNLVQVEPGASLNILLLDTLNTPLEDQYRVRQQMLSYIKELPANARIAIFGLGMHLFFLQGFTSDPAVLRAAIEQTHSSSISPLLEDSVSGGSGVSMSDMMESDDLLPQSAMANLAQFEADQQAEDVQLRTMYTLDAMNQLARYLASLPGHKNLIWFSGSFPLNIFPDGDLPDPFQAVNDFRDDVRHTADLFAQSRVAVFPVDARGLMVNPAYTLSQSTPGMTRSGRMNRANAGQTIATANRRFFQQTLAEQSTMDLIAKESGGKAFYNTNGLKQAVEKAVSFGENYYTLAYTPSNGKWDGVWRKIAIKIDQPGLHVYFRPGYFADEGNGTAVGGQKAPPLKAMQTAMLHGGPDATEVLFSVKVIPAEKETDQLSPTAHPDPKRARPPYRNFVVRFLVDLETVQLTEDAQRIHHGAAALVAVAYDREGTPVNATFKDVRIDIPSDQYVEALEKGAMTQLSIDVPVKGEYFLRMGVQDLTNNRVGALETPVAALHSYQQLQAGEIHKEPAAGK